MGKFGIKDHRLVEHARSLRVSETDVERKLWQRLRNWQVEQCKVRRQYPIAGYVPDFACEKLRPGIELDGGQHADAMALAYDQRRTERWQAEGGKFFGFGITMLLRIQKGF